MFRHQMNVFFNYNSQSCWGYKEPGPSHTQLVRWKLVQAFQEANAKLDPALKLFQLHHIFYIKSHAACSYPHIILRMNKD